MSKPNHILFLDLETTGSTEDLSIIEVGAILTEATPRLPILAEWQSVIRPRPLALIGMDDRVLDMHTKNGLLELVEAGHGIAPWAADLALCDLLTRTIGSNKQRVLLGGSGVAWFDRKYVERDMPGLARRLARRAFDVSVVRQFASLAGAQLPDPPVKTHRALDCARLARDEARLYLNLLAPMVPKTLADFDSSTESYSLAASDLDASRPGLL